MKNIGKKNHFESFQFLLNCHRHIMLSDLFIKKRHVIFAIIIWLQMSQHVAKSQWLLELESILLDNLFGRCKINRVALNMKLKNRFIHKWNLLLMKNHHDVVSRALKMSFEKKVDCLVQMGCDMEESSLSLEESGSVEDDVVNLSSANRKTSFVENSKA